MLQTGLARLIDGIGVEILMAHSTLAELGLVRDIMPRVVLIS
jgi:hypothetical protein